MSYCHPAGSISRVGITDLQWAGGNVGIDGLLQSGWAFFSVALRRNKRWNEAERDGKLTTTLLTTDGHLESWWEQPAGHAR